MVEKNLNYLLVTAPGNHLVGYVNIDMLRGHKGVVGDLARPMSITVRPDQNLKDALSKMLTYDIGIVVAVDDQGVLQGILNSKTLVSVVGETYDEHGGHWGNITTGGRIL